MKKPKNTIAQVREASQTIPKESGDRIPFIVLFKSSIEPSFYGVNFLPTGTQVGSKYQTGGGGTPFAAEVIEVLFPESDPAEPLDLFEHAELIPPHIKAIFEKYEEESMGGATYELNRKILAEIEPLGYTFEYGLDADPYELRKMETNTTERLKEAIEVLNRVKKDVLDGQTDYYYVIQFLDSLTISDPYAHIAKIWSDDTGGGTMVDYVQLNSGVVLGITDEVVTAHFSAEDVEEGKEAVSSMEIIHPDSIQGQAKQNAEIHAVVTISEDEFFETYKPIKNTNEGRNGSWDDCAFETYGEELEHVMAFGKLHPLQVWTIFDNNTIGSGYHLVNRMGYILTEIPIREGVMVEVTIDDESDDREYVAKDDSGRGMTPVRLKGSDIRATWVLDNTNDNDGDPDNQQTLEDFLQDAEIGDVFQNGTESLERIS